MGTMWEKSSRKRNIWRYQRPAKCWRATITSDTTTRAPNRILVKQFTSKSNKPTYHAPQRPVKPLSHLFLPQCCRTKPSKLSLRCPCPPNPPAPPLHWLQLPLLWWKKPQCLRLISPGWISDSSLLFSPVFVLFFFFLSLSLSLSLSLRVSVSGWWGEWSWSGGCAVGGGWSERPEWQD